MPEFFENPKIIFQEVTGKHGLIGVYDEEKFYSDHSLICCIPKYFFKGYDQKKLRKHKIYVDEKEINMSREFDILYALAVMNCQVNGFYFSKFVGYDLNVYPENIEYLPIPSIYFKTPEEERKKVFEESIEVYKNHKYGTILEWAEAELSQNKNDTIHDLLAFIANQMIVMNKRKQTLIKQFLHWLEKEIVKGSVENLKNKNKLREFHNLHEDIFFEILKQNKCIPDPTPSEIRNLIEDEIRQIMGQLSPLKDDIKLTDLLINQTTYKLYGLTKEEIKIVEGQG
jgi:hypothetical protein